MFFIELIAAGRCSDHFIVNRMDRWGHLFLLDAGVAV